MFGAHRLENIHKISSNLNHRLMSFTMLLSGCVWNGTEQNTAPDSKTSKQSGKQGSGQADAHQRHKRWASGRADEQTCKRADRRAWECMGEPVN